MLYPAPLRDFLLELASARLYRAKWTDQIQNEWMENVLEKYPDLQRARLERTKYLMELAVPDCLITGYGDIIETIECPDKNDRHVIAAAIKGHCAAIITANLRHFPPSQLEKYHLEAQHPDEFIFHQIGLNPAGVITAARNCRSRLKKPALTPEEYLNCLRRQGLPKTVAELAKFATDI